MISMIHPLVLWTSAGIEFDRTHTDSTMDWLDYKTEVPQRLFGLPYRSDKVQKLLALPIPRVESAAVSPYVDVSDIAYKRRRMRCECEPRLVSTANVNAMRAEVEAMYPTEQWYMIRLHQPMLS